MSILIALVIGALVGAGVSIFLSKGADLLLLSIISGVVGSIIGLATHFFLSTSLLTASLFDPVAMLFSVFGAALLAIAFNTVNRLETKHEDG